MKTNTIYIIVAVVALALILMLSSQYLTGMSVSGTVGALTSTDHIQGNKDAKTVLIEYGDYQCEDCKLVAKTIQTVLPNYGGQVRFVFHHLPIEDRHPKAMDAAVFSECANQQGLFWEAHDALMEATSIDEATFSRIALDLKLDRTALNACRAQPEIAEAIRSQIEIARGDGVSGVPLVFVGTRASYGSIPAEELQTEINRYLSP
jgi:protein-disulfide isomerase